MTFHSGKNGTATVNGTELPLIGWDVQSTATLIEFKNSKSGSYPIRDDTFRDATATLDIDMDFDANPFAAPIAITAGATLTNVKCYLNGTSGLYWNFASAKVSGTPQSLTVEGKIVTRVTIATSGPVTAPGGATP